VSARSCSPVKNRFRRAGAAGVAATLLALVACDLWIGGFRAWWDRHSFTGSVVSSLLVLAVTALIVDEVVARRQRRDRAVSVAVQGLIVFGQARRACDAVLASGTNDLSSTSAQDELRTLANMLLAASPNLFDDPEARLLLERVERISVSMLQSLSATPGSTQSADSRERLASQMAQAQAAVDPLVARIPIADRSGLEGSPQE